MRPMTLFCVVLGALLGFLETSGQGRDVNPEPPVAKARAVASLGELPVEVSIDGYRAAVVFTMPDSASGQSVRYSASIEDLSGSDLGEVSGAKEVAQDGRLELRMSGPKLAAPADGIDYVVVYRITGAFFFGAAASIGSVLDRISDHYRALIVDFSAVPFLDSTGANVMEGLTQKAHRRGVRLYVSGASEDIRRALALHGLRPPEVGFVNTVEDALADYREKGPVLRREFRARP